MGGAGNVALEEAALEAALDRRGLNGKAANPWFFPSPDAYRAMLEQAGFTVASITSFARPTRIDSDILGWLETFAETFLSRVDSGERANVLAEVADELAPRLSDSQGNWTLDYVRLRFSAHVD